MSAVPLLPSHPRFVTLEGGEGAGKSTVMAALRAALEGTGQNVVCTREPGGTPLAERIRSLLLDATDEPVSAQAELLLVFAARAQHVRQTIVPALRRGDWVLSDRFTDASYAYQGAARGGDMAFIAELERRAVGIVPALTLLLDVPVDIGRARLTARGTADRIETEQVEFFETVRTAYLDRARRQPQRFRVIDASQAPQAVADAAVQALHAHMQALA